MHNNQRCSVWLKKHFHVTTVARNHTNNSKGDNVSTLECPKIPTTIRQKSTSSDAEMLPNIPVGPLNYHQLLSMAVNVSTQHQQALGHHIITGKNALLSELIMETTSTGS